MAKLVQKLLARSIALDSEMPKYSQSACSKSRCLGRVVPRNKVHLRNLARMFHKQFERKKWRQGGAAIPAHQKGRRSQPYPFHRGRCSVKQCLGRKGGLFSADRTCPGQGACGTLAGLDTYRCSVTVCSTCLTGQDDGKCNFTRSLNAGKW